MLPLLNKPGETGDDIEVSIQGVKTVAQRNLFQELGIDTKEVPEPDIFLPGCTIKHQLKNSGENVNVGRRPGGRILFNKPLKY
ncbi:hypothetical protein BGZ63DRAFT_379673 [Mariannaea sp. PMI_226]|nr:hypothetical protein BGZ63DRAFT_379673 [Mariannaea sp. PMI_226]